MKVTLLKDFGDHKKGDTVEVEEERANYWELVGVAKKDSQEKDNGNDSKNKPPRVKKQTTKPSKKKR